MEGRRLDQQGQRHIVDLEKSLDFRYPAVAHEGDVVGMLIVSGVGSLIGELHREAEMVVVLGADLPQRLELGDALDRAEDALGVGEEPLFLQRVLRVLQGEYDGVTDHFSSTTATHSAQRGRLTFFEMPIRRGIST